MEFDRRKFKWILNILIIVVGVFFAYQLYSYSKTKSDQKKSIDIYNFIEDKALVIKNENKEESIDFDYLKSINADIFAWIKSEEGSIDYPVMHCKDNYKYLYTAANGERNVAGGIFMDYRNVSIDDSLVLIYGHEMNNRTMFGSLFDYKNSPTKTGFNFYVEGKKFKTRAVLAGIISGEEYINPKDYMDFDKRKSFFNLIKKNAVYDEGYELKEDDNIIALVTCTYERKNSRLVVVTIR